MQNEIRTSPSFFSLWSHPRGRRPRARYKVKCTRLTFTCLPRFSGANTCSLSSEIFEMILPSPSSAINRIVQISKMFWCRLFIPTSGNECSLFKIHLIPLSKLLFLLQKVTRLDSGFLSGWLNFKWFLLENGTKKLNILLTFRTFFPIRTFFPEKSPLFLSHAP